MPQGQFGLGEPQRRWADISLNDTVSVKIYDPRQNGGHRFIGTLDAEISFARQMTSNTPFDQDELAEHFKKVLRDVSWGCFS